MAQDLPKLAFADEHGNALEHDTLLALADAGDRQQGPPAPPLWTALPTVGSTLSALPGRLPVGWDPTKRRPVVLETMTVRGRTFRPVALAALCPPGWTRTHLPAFEQTEDAQVLPLFAYTGAGYRGGELVATALRTDPRTHWDPALYATADLDQKIEARVAASPRSRILSQVARCAHEYRCFTAQNVFYERFEGAIPLSSTCNSACIGCLSQQDEGGPPPSQWRIAQGPTVEDCVAVGLHHFDKAPREAIISWGQGCEGEPLLRADVIAAACREIRRHTTSGTLHINTNGSRPDALLDCARAGLDSCRISLNSAVRKTYDVYYRPTGYTFDDVRSAARRAKAAGLFVSLNVLMYPGVSDRTSEAAALIDFVTETGVDMVQTRNLCIDPALYEDLVGDSAEMRIGIRTLLHNLKQAKPDLKIGNYNVPKEQFHAPLRAT